MSLKPVPDVAGRFGDGKGSLEHLGVASNAGSLTDSLIVSSRDYLEAAAPAVFEFSKE